MSGKRLTLTKLSNGAEVELVKNVITIGRQYDCDIQLTEGYPSRKHAQLVIENDAIFIEDMRSANGTYVNGARITGRTRLSGGDRIRFHIEEFKFNTDMGFGEPEPERVQPPDQATIWASAPQPTVLNVSDAAPNLGGMKSLFSPQNVASEALQSMSADQAVPNVQTIPSADRVDVGDSTVIERLAPAAGVQTVFRKVEEPKPVARPAPVEPASASRTIFRSAVEDTRTPPPPQAASPAPQLPPRREVVVQPTPIARPTPIVRPQPVVRPENRAAGVSQQFVAAAAPETPIAAVLPQPEPLAPSLAAVMVPPSAAAIPAGAVALAEEPVASEEPMIAERLSRRGPADATIDQVESFAEPVARPASRGPSTVATPQAASDDAAAKLIVAASGEATRRPGAWADPAAFLNDANRTKFIDPAALKALVTEGPSLGVLAGAGSVSSPHLFVASGSQTGTKIQLLAGPGGRQEWTIGSEPGREVVLSDSGVSALHAKLINEGQRWKLIDQMSANGTFVNSKRSNVSFLTAGDRVRFGPVECVFQTPRSEASADGVFGNRRNKLIAVAVVVVGIGAACLFTLL
jgi:pSer/pThr/pTyr-binding forkhead associated (FHA) protein